MSELIDDKARVEELMDDLFDTLKSITHYYNGILEELKAGTYTPKKARDDHEHLMFNEGNDLMSVMEDLGEYA